jgi:hypothetical protein
MRTIPRTIPPIALALGLVAIPAAARASDSSAAQALFDEGRRLIKDGRWAAACSKLEESQRLDPGMGTLFHLSACYAQTGRIASAWSSFLEVAREAKARGETARERVARQRASELEPKLSRVKVNVPSPEAELEVKRDGRVVPRAEWGETVPVDEGDHVIEASAPGKKPWRSAVRVEGDARKVVVEVPRLEDVVPQAPPSVAVAAAVPAPPPVAPSPPSEPTATLTASNASPPPAEDPSLRAPRDDTGDAQRGVGIVLVGVGLLSAATGGGFAWLSKRYHDEALARCTRNVCDATGVSLRTEAVRDGNIATATIAVGAVAILGGVILWASAPARKAHGTARLGAVASPQATEVVLQGAW